jgi:hypothetical protein
MYVSAGHQLHYDSDDEGQGGVRNPSFTSVLYLAPNTVSPCSNSSSSTHKFAPTEAADSSNQAEQLQQQQQDQRSFVGGPTLVTDQLLGGPLATKGWLAYPATNRFVMFDGKYLHGKQVLVVTALARRLYDRLSRAGGDIVHSAL